MRRVLPTGWIPDLRPDATIADAVRTILSEIGLTIDEALLHLWAELEADILVRTGPNPDRDEHRGRCRAVLERPVAEMLADLPLSRHIDGAALLAERSREIRWLNDELFAVRRDLDAQRAESEERRAALEVMREESAQQAAEIGESDAETSSPTREPISPTPEPISSGCDRLRRDNGSS